MSSLYGRHKKIAPLNRTLFLEEGDAAKYLVERLPETDFATLAEALDKVFCGDAIAGMSKLPSESVDIIFADPPYNIGKNYEKGGRMRLPEPKYAEWTAKWLQEAFRLLKPSGSIYLCTDWERSGLIQTELEKLFAVKNRITWRREKGRGSSRNWKNNMEDIWFAVKSENYKFNLQAVKIKKEVIAPYKENGAPKDWQEDESGKYRHTCPPNIWLDTVVPFWSMWENTPHPTQKPELVLERIILASTDEGEIALDPFMGSGTTAAVAHRLNRRFIGFELNPDYVLLTMKRLATRRKPSQK